MNKDYYINLLDRVDFAIAEHEMIYDKLGNPVDYRYLYVNQVFCDMMGKSKEQMIGKLAYEVFANIEKTWLKRYQEVVSTGESISFTNYTKEVDRYFNIYAYKSGENRFVTSFRDVTSYIGSLPEEQKVNVISNLFDSAKTAYFEFDLREKSFEYSDVLSDIIGMKIITYEDYIRFFRKYIHPNDKDRFNLKIEQLFAGRFEEFGMQFRFLHQQTQNYMWISFFVFVDQRYRNVPVKLRGLIKDIDAEKRRELEVEHMEKLFLETRKVANIATFYYDMKQQYFRPSKELDEFVGIENLVNIDQFRSIVHPDDLEAYDYSTNEIRNRPDGMITNYRIFKHGGIRYIQSSIFMEKDEEGVISGVFGILKDITELEESKSEIEYFANHDVLTGLYNRNNFERYSKKLEKDNQLALMILDVDGLKLVNDAFGHMEGDQLLIHLADILIDVAGMENVYRIGGDEFIITISPSTEEKVAKIESKIKDEVSKFRVYGVGFGVSVGYSYLDEGTSFEDAFRNAENIMYRRKLTERKSRKSTVLNTIMETMHQRTEETKEHCQRVGDYATELLRSTGRKRDYEIEDIRLIADVHDIGKISISDHLLTKKDKLTAEEYLQVQYHCESGYKIVSNIIDNEDIAIAVLYHHERYDGKGYPHGLKGEEIPLYSRIISICDAFDAMTTNRVYSRALSKEAAIMELRLNKGTQFDPDLVDQFIKIIQKW